jgi:uncharacterized DUF497 family protein
MVHVQRLIWDEWNSAHIVRHDVDPEEVEDVCNSNPVAFQTYQDRLLVVGVTRHGRALGVVLEPVGNGIYYVVTARSASRKERRL